MSALNITIDGIQLAVPEGATILQAARAINIEIPTLCYLNLHQIESKAASCRICVVEVEGRKNLAPACATPVLDGMVVKTSTMRVLNARKTVLELLLSDHPKDCLSCTKAGDCDLQYLAKKFGIRKVSLEGEQSMYPIDESISIIRDMNKCIMCRRCENVCAEVQNVGAIAAINRGFEAVISPAFGTILDNTKCTYCGQCVAVCPTGALTEREYISDVIKAINDPEKIALVQVAPAVRAALGEAFGLPVGTEVTGQMVAALKRLGFDYVFDTDFAADVTIMEESTELLTRLTGKENTHGVLPLLTSCCPGWVNFMETQYPDLLDHLSTTRSPQQIFGALAKSYFAEQLGIDRDQMIVVSVMPCIAKKYEAQRPEFNNDVDISISTRELARLIKAANIQFTSLLEEDFDQPLGESSGAAVIFGTTGGVMEAALRTAYEKVTSETLEKVEFESVRGFEGIRITTVTMKDVVLNIGIAHGLKNAGILMNELREGNPRNLSAIEVMACPGGCIGGAGQPYHHGCGENITKRCSVLYQADEAKILRKSHENPSVKEVYANYLGIPMSEKAHKLLHTYYEEKERM